MECEDPKVKDGLLDIVANIMDFVSTITTALQYTNNK